MCAADPDGSGRPVAHVYTAPNRTFLRFDDTFPSDARDEEDDVFNAVTHSVWCVDETADLTADDKDGEGGSDAAGGTDAAAAVAAPPAVFAPAPAAVPIRLTIRRAAASPKSAPSRELCGQPGRSAGPVRRCSVLGPRLAAARVATANPPATGLWRTQRQRPQRRRRPRTEARPSHAHVRKRWRCPD